MTLDPNTADPKLLAEALRRECEKSKGKTRDCPACNGYGWTWKGGHRIYVRAALVKRFGSFDAWKDAEGSKCSCHYGQIPIGEAQFAAALLAVVDECLANQKNCEEWWKARLVIRAAAAAFIAAGGTLAAPEGRQPAAREGG